LRWPGIKDSLRTQQEKNKRQAEAAQAERKSASEARTKKEKEDNARQERLRILESVKSRYDSDIFELSRAVRKLEADLKRFQDQDDEDIRQEKARNSWWAYLASPVYGKVNETDEQKQARETARLHRLASKSIKGSELDREKAKLQRLQNALQDVNVKIAVEKKKEEDEKRKLEDEARARKQKMEQEERIRMMREMRERAAKAQKERDEQAAKEARKAQAAREAQEAQERVRMAAAAERRRKEAEERAEAMRAAEEAARKARKTWDKWAERSTKSTCRHDRFWPKVEGRQLCSNCYAVQRRFAFQCPGCQMVACANCRQNLRGEKRNKGGSFGRRYDFASDDDDYTHDYSYYYD
jgi:septal ring factor EnvC (AmiA/AmiB activator)